MLRQPPRSTRMTHSFPTRRSSDLTRGGPGLARLETVVDDMPFLVDSLSMAIRDTGAPIDWLVHPIMAVARNGGRWDVMADDGHTESLTHLEFDPFPHTSAYASLDTTGAGLLPDIRDIGRASCRERLCQYREISEVAVALNNK